MNSCAQIAQSLKDLDYEKEDLQYWWLNRLKHKKGREGSLWN